MSTQLVDRSAANERISRAVRAAMAARGIRDDKQLSQITGIAYDTLLRRLSGKPWLADEILTVAAALDVDARTLLEDDPGEWFRRDGVTREPAGYRPGRLPVAIAA